MLNCIKSFYYNYYNCIIFFSFILLIWWVYTDCFPNVKLTLHSIVSVSIFIPSSSARAFPYSTLSPAFTVCRHFDDGHSDWCEVVSQFSFDLHFSNNEWCWASFLVFASHLYVFLGEISVWVFFPLFDWVVSFSGIELYELLIYFEN